MHTHCAHQQLNQSRLSSTHLYTFIRSENLVHLLWPIRIKGKLKITFQSSKFNELTE